MKQRTCSISGCGRPHRCLSLCNLHYRRQRRLGSAAAEMKHGAPLNFLLDRAFVYDGDECLIWPFARTDAGYGHLWVGGVLEYAHRLTCIEENGEPPSPTAEAAHSCGRGHLGCVTRRHLRWATPSQNSADRLLHDTHNRGSRHANAKLKEADVQQIRRLSSTTDAAELSLIYGVSVSNIYLILSGGSWSWLDDHS